MPLTLMPQTIVSHSRPLRALPALCLAALALGGSVVVPTALHAQQAGDQAPVRDWRLPFRAPQANLVPPEEMFRHLQVMLDIAQRAPAGEKHLGEDGEEVVDDPAWQAARDRLAEVRFDPGYLSLVLRDSRHAAHRLLAFYAAQYCPQPQYAMQLIEHIPGEPERGLRQAAMQWAVPYVEEWLPKLNEGDIAEWNRLAVGPAGEKPPRPGDPTVSLDPGPFLALAALDEPIDQRQALWFLARCTAARPSFGMDVLDRGRQLLKILAAVEDPEVRLAVVDLLTELDPDRDRAAEHSAVGDGDPVPDPAALLAWLEAVDYQLFPPLRRISAGLYELYPRADRDQLVAVAMAGIQDGSLLTMAGGKTADGDAYYGLRIQALPEPLDRLGLGIGDTLTSINGLPLTSAQTLSRRIELSARPGSSFLLEYVDRGGVPRAIDYRVR